MDANRTRSTGGLAAGGCSGARASCWLAGCVALAAAILPAPASATSGESFLHVDGGYLLLAGDGGNGNGGALGMGFGYYVSDFSLVDTRLYAGATTGDETLLSAGGGEAALRILIDATEWVPSVGLAVGWMGFYGMDSGLEPGSFYYGGTVCLEYRAQRDSSIRACGTGGTFPLDDQLPSFVTATVDLSAYLPYWFE